MTAPKPSSPPTKQASSSQATTADRGKPRQPATDRRKGPKRKGRTPGTPGLSEPQRLRVTRQLASGRTKPHDGVCACDPAATFRQGYRYITLSPCVLCLRVADSFRYCGQGSRKSLVTERAQLRQKMVPWGRDGCQSMNVASIVSRRDGLTGRLGDLVKPAMRAVRTPDLRPGIAMSDFRQ